MPTPAAAIPVDILDETTAHIHGEAIPLPAGVDLDQAVLSHLQLEAAGLGHAVSACIDDRRYGVKATLTVHPDGTTATHTPAPADAPPPADQTPIAGIQALAIRGHLDAAIQGADQHLIQLTNHPGLGPTHWQTLEAAELRAHLAWIKEDYTYAYRSWSWISATWREQLGPCPRRQVHDHNQCRRIAITTRNAAAAWARLPPQDALAAGQEILELLAHNSGSTTTPAARDIQALLKRLATHGS
ncbi:hypothetical protein [Streptomyces sp. NPDC059003]|uniref:hypothetical protein n=1 Tax=Streptomyces sp. NPDC059003 TaxID=3346691 RepID=UPI00368C9DAE